MLKQIKFFLLLILVVFLQIFVLPNITFFNAYPNIILIIGTCYLFGKNFSSSLTYLLIGGVFLDIYSGLFFGIFTISFLVIYLIYYFILKKFVTDSVFWVVLLGFFFASLLSDLYPFLAFGYNWVIFLLNALLNMILGTLVFYLLFYEHPSIHPKYKFKS